MDRVFVGLLTLIVKCMWSMNMHFIPGDPLCIIHFNCVTNDPPAPPHSPLTPLWSYCIVRFFEMILAHSINVDRVFVGLLTLLVKCMWSMNMHFIPGDPLCIIHFNGVTNDPPAPPHSPLTPLELL